MKDTGRIEIKNQGPSTVVIDIEGIIGVPEAGQFETADNRVATYEKFNEAVEKIKILEADSVRVNIRSTGGNLNDALMIYQALCALPARVETHCYGYVASAATIIAQAASVGGRFVSSGSLYLIHNSRVALEGTKEQALRTVEMLDKSDGQIAEIYADRSGMPLQGFLELMNADGGEGRWLTPDEAVGYGLADEVERVNPLGKLGQKVKNLLSRLDNKLELAATGFGEPTSDKVVDNDYISLRDKAELRQWGNYFEELAVANQALTDRVEELEAQKSRRLVLPTSTKPHEDPMPVADDLTMRPRLGNLKSYEGDLANFS